MLNIKTQNNVFICLQLIFQLQNLLKEIPHPPPVFYFSPLLLWGVLTSKCDMVVPLIFFFLPSLHATSGDTAEDLHYHLHNNASNHKGEQLAFIFEMLLKQSSAVPCLIHLYCSNTSTTWHIDVTSWNLWWYESNPVEIGSFFPKSLYFAFHWSQWNLRGACRVCSCPKSLLNPCEHCGPCISYQWWLFLSLGVTY